MKLKLTNAEIYNITDSLIKNPIRDEDYIPVTCNFFIHKNIKILMELRQEIDVCRNTIITQHGEKNDNGEITIKKDCVTQANQALMELSNITQEVDLYPIPLSMLADIQLSSGTLNGLMVMITIPAEMDDAIKNGQLEELAQKGVEVHYQDE